jgi:hypothetical protein
VHRPNGRKIILRTAESTHDVTAKHIPNKWQQQYGAGRMLTPRKEWPLCGVMRIRIVKRGRRRLDSGEKNTLKKYERSISGGMQPTANRN